MSAPQNSPAKTGPEAAAPPKPLDAVQTMINENWPAIKAVLPKHLTPERMARIAYIAIKQSPGLARCTPISLANAVIEASMLGLEIGGPQGLAYLVPFKAEATLIIGYKGLMDLGYRSGRIKNFTAHPVYEKDHFAYSYGLDDRLEHRPAEKDRGLLKYAYCLVRFQGGGYDFEVVTASDIAVVKSQSAGAKSGASDCPWNDPKNEWTMWVKTAIRRLAKRVPQSPELARAAALDELAENGLGQRLGHIIDITPPPSTAADLSAALKAQAQPGEAAQSQNPPEDTYLCPDRKDGTRFPASACAKCPKAKACPEYGPSHQ